MLTTSRSPASGPQVGDLAEELFVTCARFTRTMVRLSSAESPTAVWRTLAILDEYGAVRISDLAVLDRCSQPTATAMVQRLEAEGAVVRTPDATDRRAVLVSLSPAGRELLGRLRSQLTAELSPRLHRLEPQRLAELTPAVDTLNELLQGESALREPPRTAGAGRS